MIISGLDAPCGLTRVPVETQNTLRLILDASCEFKVDVAEGIGVEFDYTVIPKFNVSMHFTLLALGLEPAAAWGLTLDAPWGLNLVKGY